MNSRKKPALGRNLSSMLSQSTLDEVQGAAHDELRNLPRGGHDYRKLYAAYKKAT